MRRKPIKHRVKTHKRNGRTVKSYQRGKGKSSKVVSKRKIINEEGSARQTWETYTVIFHFHDKKTEKIVLGARDSDDALNQALKIRKRKAKPVKVEVIDSIADVAASITSGLTQVAGGIKLGIKTGKAKTELAGESAMEDMQRRRTEQTEKQAIKQLEHQKRMKELEYKKSEITRLVKDSAKDNEKALTARQKLKMKYPEIFKRLAFLRV